MRVIALAGQRITIALAGTAHTAIALAGTVTNFVTAVLTPWALDFSTEDHSSYVALL